MPLFLPLILASCAQEGPGPPPVDVEILAAAVADVLLAEAIASETPVTVRDSMKTVFYVGTLSEHGLDTTSFDSLMEIVRSEAEWVDTVFTRAGDIISQRQAELLGEND